MPYVHSSRESLLPRAHAGRDYLHAVRGRQVASLRFIYHGLINCHRLALAKSTRRGSRFGSQKEVQTPKVLSRRLVQLLSSSPSIKLDEPLQRIFALFELTTPGAFLKKLYGALFESQTVNCRVRLYAAKWLLTQNPFHEECLRFVREYDILEQSLAFANIFKGSFFFSRCTVST